MAAIVRFELTVKAKQDEYLSIEDIIAIKKAISEKLRDKTIPMINKVSNSTLQFIGVKEETI